MAASYDRQRMSVGVLNQVHTSPSICLWQRRLNKREGRRRECVSTGLRRPTHQNGVSNARLRNHLAACKFTGNRFASRDFFLDMISMLLETKNGAWSTYQLGHRDAARSRKLCLHKKNGSSLKHVLIYVGTRFPFAKLI